MRRWAGQPATPRSTGPWRSPPRSRCPLVARFRAAIHRSANARGHTRRPMERKDLTARERAMLDFERGWWRLEGPKEAAIRERLRMSSTRYYRVLGELIEQPAA